jgi:hypothetical protein
VQGPGNTAVFLPSAASEPLILMAFVNVTFLLKRLLGGEGSAKDLIG